MIIKIVYTYMELNFKDYLLPYQKKWIACDDEFAIYIKSRRIGISYAEALRAVITRLQKREDFFFVSKNEKTGQEFIRYCKLWVNTINTIVGKSNYIDDKKFTTSTIIFPNGSRIISLSSSPDSLRGLGGSITLDEFAFSESAEDLYIAAQPLIMWGGKLRIISTPNGSGGNGAVFDKLFTTKNQFKKFRTTLPMAVDEGFALISGHWKEHDSKKNSAINDNGEISTIKKINARYIEKIKNACLNEFAYRQEFLCENVTREGLVYSNYGDKLTYPTIPTTEKLPSAAIRSYIGLDFGFNDPTAILVFVECENNKIYLVEEIYETKMDVDKLGHVLLKLQDKWSTKFESKYKNLQGGNWMGVFCDASRPEIVSLVSRYGVHIQNRKVKDVNAGIAVVDALYRCGRLKVFDCCKNFIYESKNYNWGKDNKPQHNFSHTQDACRYALSSAFVDREIISYDENPITPEIDTIKRLNIAQSEEEIRKQEIALEIKKEKEYFNYLINWFPDEYLS